MKLGPLQTEWLRALRSGEFPQGTMVMFRLPHSGGDTCLHCCLGVATLVAEANGVKLDWDTSTNVFDVRDAVFAKTTGNWHHGFPPQCVLSALRLRSYEAEELARMNDRGNSFQKIANYIEQDAAEIFEGPA